MLRTTPARVAAFALFIGSLWWWTPRVALGQAWNDPRTIALVEQATRRRAEQLADTALVDYRAEAHGYLAFLAQVGEGFPEPPRIVKADELALTVYWRAPNLSKQVIQGRRDTLLLPTDIQYHRDHLGIVQNNFPDVIRLGDGDEVRDVPHPLSPRGQSEYDFAIADSLRIAFPGRTVHVYEVKVRPRDDRQPRVIGAVYIDPDGGQVVRMALSFTRAAFLDRQLEDLSIVLENGLVGTRFWLPRRQEIEIRRTGSWMDYPVRGLIRGRWEISNYQVNVGLSRTLFGGPEIVQVPREVQRNYQWGGKILDSMPPDVRAVTDEDVQRVQAEARQLVRAQALQRARTATISARSLSELVRVNRIEGLAVGVGLRKTLGAGWSAQTRGRYGFSDHEPKGEASLAWMSPSGRGLRLFASADFRESGDALESSRVVNSIAAQEFGSDRTDPWLVRTAGAEIDLGTLLGVRHRLSGAYESHDPLTVQATPANGAYEPTILAGQVTGTRVGYELERPTSLWLFGTEVQGRLRGTLLFAQPRPGYAAFECPQDVACIPPDWRMRPGERSRIARVSLDLSVERPFGRQRLVLRTVGGAVDGDRGVTTQDLVYLGGPVTGPGYAFHEFTATAGVSQRLEWRVPVPFWSLRLGRFGRSPATATLAPFAQLVLVESAPGLVSDQSPIRPGLLTRTSGGYPSVGVGLLTFFDLLRLDVARGLRDGRWTFSVDVTRDLWGVL